MKLDLSRKTYDNLCDRVIEFDLDPDHDQNQNDILHDMFELLAYYRGYIERTEETIEKFF